MPWFDCLTTTCDPFAGIPVTDLDIAIAVPFSQWSESYLLWPDELWYSVRYGVPCMDVDKNAYHIQRLAAAMLERLEWIGTKPELVVIGSLKAITAFAQ